jgi:hypothetical protein
VGARAALRHRAVSARGVVNAEGFEEDTLVTTLTREQVARLAPLQLDVHLRHDR